MATKSRIDSNVIKYSVDELEMEEIRNQPFKYVPEFFNREQLAAKDKSIVERKLKAPKWITDKFVLVGILVVYLIPMYIELYNGTMRGLTKRLLTNGNSPFFLFVIASVFFYLSARYMQKKIASNVGIKQLIAHTLISLLFLIPLTFSDNWFIGTYNYWIPFTLLGILYVARIFSGDPILRGKKTSYRMLQQFDAATYTETKYTYWGTPGGNISTATQFGDKAEIGAAGEKFFGEKLNKIVELYPHVRVFHGLCFTPGKKGADVDHAVLIGDQLILIDSKNWKHASYSWGTALDGSKIVLRDGAVWDAGHVHMENAVRLWNRYLNGDGWGMKVSSIICMTKMKRRGGDGYIVNNTGSPSTVKLMSIEDTLSHVEELAANSEKVLMRVPLKKTIRQIQSL